MEKDRLLAFSDGVIAIIITIMVLELHAPHAATLHALVPLAPIFLSYVLSFVFIAIYWNNHHHMLATAERVNGAILWANMHLLFWLSLIPFTTAWMGENHGARWPTVLYGVSLIAPAIAYVVLQNAIIASHGADHVLKRAIGGDWKGKLSPLLYLAGIVLAALWSPIAGQTLFVAVALLWLVPDRRIERAITAPK
jgi:uncharacterized membrane protein